MHVVQATAWYPPYGLGGTEVYLEALVDELAAKGIGGTVLVPRHALAVDRYEHRATAVETYPVGDTPTRSELRHQEAHKGFEHFRTALGRTRRTAGIYHQHSWTRGCGLDHLAAARALGFRTVVTVHVPGNICLRGTMMRAGSIQCDGLIQAARCGCCFLESRGLPAPLAHTIAALPQSVAVRAAGVDGRLATALSARALAAEKRDQLRSMAANADVVVAVCRWLYEALAANGVPQEKLRLSRQGLSRELARTLALSAGRDDAKSDRQPLRIVLLGRSTPVKGIDALVRAVLALPRDCAVKLTVHAVASSAEERAHDACVRDLAASDPRIVMAGPAARHEIPEILARHDVLAVPSQWLETGPLVVLEAQAAGLFVLGSRLGGIAELVDGAASGQLVEPASPKAWSEAIADLTVRHAAGRLGRSPAKVRTIDTVADEMAEIYRTL